MHDAPPPSFDYVIRRIPPGRFPFRRWRWELWQGMLLVAAGWVTTPGQVERALRVAASRRMHQLAEVTPLRPDRGRLVGSLSRTRSARLETGVGPCLLVPAGDHAVDAAAA